MELISSWLTKFLFSMMVSHMVSVKSGSERGFWPSDFNLFCKCLSQLERSSCKIENYIFLYSYSNYSISQEIVNHSEKGVYCLAAVILRQYGLRLAWVTLEDHVFSIMK